jgi:tetratricopeptide (TPR) repeat protein
MNLNRRADAMAQYDEILKISGNNPIVLNDLAWHLRESDPDRALRLAEKASSIAPQSASIMDTLAAILLMQGDTAGAQRIIENALEIKPESPTLLFRRVMLLEATGKTDEAIMELGSLLKKKQEFPEKAEAEHMLQRLRGS